MILYYRLRHWRFQRRDEGFRYIQRRCGAPRFLIGLGFSPLAALGPFGCTRQHAPRAIYGRSGTRYARLLQRHRDRVPFLLGMPWVAPASYLISDIVPLLADLLAFAGWLRSRVAIWARPSGLRSYPLRGAQHLPEHRISSYVEYVDPGASLVCMACGIGF